MSGRNHAAAAARRGFRRLAFEAVVCEKRRVPMYADQAEMCQLLQVTDRTLRAWARIGFPVENGERQRPRYPLPDAYLWGLCYRTLCRRGEPPSFLTMAEAAEWHLVEEIGRDSTAFVQVPLDWDHPMRRELLERAAAGRAPPPEDGGD